MAKVPAPAAPVVEAASASCSRASSPWPLRVASVVVRAPSSRTSAAPAVALAAYDAAGQCKSPSLLVRGLVCSPCRCFVVSRGSPCLWLCRRAGVDTGVNLRLAGEGDVGPLGGPPGNMYVHCQVRDDPFFRRDNNDVHVEVPLTLTQAVLGTTLSIPSLDGEVELVVPAGTQPTDTHLMRNRGIPKLGRNSQGHQYVHFKLEIPKCVPNHAVAPVACALLTCSIVVGCRNLTDRQRELMEEFAEEESSHPKAGFLSETIDRIKKYIHGE